MSRFWSGTRFESGLGLDKIQISVLKLKIWKKWKLNSKNSKNRKIWKKWKSEKNENLERNLKIWSISKIFYFSNFQILDSIFFKILNFSNFRFQFSSFSILKLKFEFCPDPVQTRIWFWSGPDKIQIWVWTRKIPDSGRNLD